MSEDKQERVNLASRPPGVPTSNPAEAPTWDVPVHDVELPSRGLVYPPESSLAGKLKLEIRSMTAKEEDILTSRSLLRQGKAMTMLLQNCVLDKSVNPDEMLVGDRNALLCSIRMSGYGSEYSTKVDCPACSEQFEHDFDIGKIAEPKFLDEEPDVPGANVFSFTLPSSKKVVKFKLMTGADDKALSVAMERLKKTAGVNGIEGNVTMQLFYQVISVDGETDRTKIKRFIDRMPALDSRPLRSHIEKISPGLDMLSFITCPSCGEESEVDMPITAGFFWPDLG